MLKITEYLQTHTLDELELKHSIKLKRHSIYSNLILLKYSQLETKITPMTRECRGIILDQDRNFKPVCYTYKRFPNYGETWGDEINWNNLRIYEKLDGSLCQLYHYNNQWQVATSGSPDAGGNVGDFDKTFKELFWETWNDLNYTLPCDINICYAFEMTTPYNVVVIQHQESSITLIGARNLITQRELNPVIEANNNGWRCVKIFDFDDQRAIEEALKHMSGADQEGFVVVDTNNYHRVKMKCVDYVKRHRLISCMSKRNMLDAVRTNEGEEVLLYAPQFEKLHWEIKYNYERIVGEITGFYNAIKHIDGKKEFAMLAKDQIFSGTLFGLKHGKVNNIKQYLAEMNIKTLEQWLGIKSEL